MAIEFDPSYELWNICQLVSGTKDGFPEVQEEIHYDAGADPPHWQSYDPPHWQDNSDPPHWED